MSSNTIQPTMANFRSRLKEILAGSNLDNQKTEGPRPVIRRPEDDLPPELKYAEKPGRTYRVFPDTKTEADIIVNCPACGYNYNGVLQTHCRACNQGRAIYKIDVTDQPFYTLPPQKEGEAPSVKSEELIPTFGGSDIRLGNDVSTVFAHGNDIYIGSDADIIGIAGNSVWLSCDSNVIAVAAKNSAMINANTECEKGLTAKEIVLKADCTVGWIVVPDGGTLKISPDCNIGDVFLGQGATIVADGSNDITINRLIILGPNCSITLYQDCTIETIETNHQFRLVTGNNYRNDTQNKLQADYNLVELISEVVDLALGKKD